MTPVLMFTRYKSYFSQQVFSADAIRGRRYRKCDFKIKCEVWTCNS